MVYLTFKCYNILKVKSRKNIINYHKIQIMKFNVIDWIVLVLVIVGGLNWGLVGIFDFDLVAAIFGVASALSKIIYTLVGISALYLIYLSTKIAKE